MKRPDLESILRPLKSFQRRTVDHAFHQMFYAPNSTSRFLVADEVGLGKTLVARGIIARTIDALWDDVDRIDVIYICSNSSIARSNLPKLQIGSGDERSVALATRLTMLATQLAPRAGRAGLAHSKLNFVSFTPGTSFEMGHSTGQAPERVVLFRLLAPLFPEQRTALMNLLQGWVTNTERWRTRLKHDHVPLDPGIEKSFHAEVLSNVELRERITEVLDEWFARQRKHLPDEAVHARNAIVGELRKLLARICVQGLEPDLVILDEFQRFKTLFDAPPDSHNPAVQLARALFDAQTPEGHPVRSLLLSATPYKLYTADAEIDQEDHYEDFLSTTRFLFRHDESRVATLRHQLADFGRALKHAAHGDDSGVYKAKAAVEVTLRSVMARTERVAASDDRDAMVEEPSLAVTMQPEDVEQYLAADALFRAVGDRDPMPFWKSAPYLAHFMHGYRFNDRLTDALDVSPGKVDEVLQNHQPAFIASDQLATWQELPLANAKLRQLAHELLDGGLWKLLWIPPTVPYWSLEGPFENQQATKTLIFSAWNVVPDVLSAVLSYEAERRMVDDVWGHYDQYSRQATLLQLSKETDGTLNRHRLLLLLLPCLPLADGAHPLHAPPSQDRREWVRSRVGTLLSDLSLPNPIDGEVDDRWEWAWPVLLDPELKNFIRSWVGDEQLPKPSEDLFAGYAKELIDITPQSMGRRPESLEELIVDAALGAPGVLAARTLASTKLSENDRRWYSVYIADAFWKLFNRPPVTKLLPQLAQQFSPEASRQDLFYWRLVMRYCRDGNLQAVLDESWHLIWEQHGWSADKDYGDAIDDAVVQLADSIQPPRSSVQARFFNRKGGSTAFEEMRLRTALALRFGDIRTEERLISQDGVRNAFNSPFRPFVLASTSVGQEGLDFHPWCRRIVHWDLPGNPVDLEQREGRVHRYKGLAVRQNVALAHGQHALDQWEIGKDLWELIFSLAFDKARSDGKSDLEPHWMAPGPVQVQRHVPLLPFSAEVEAFRRLKRQLAAYRVVFGQPRQEELVTLLDHAQLDSEKLMSWAIDLQPDAHELG